MDDFDRPVSIVIWQPRAMPNPNIVDTVMVLRPRAGGLNLEDLHNVLALAREADVASPEQELSIEALERALEQPYG